MSGREDESDGDAFVFVEYNRMLYRQTRGRRPHVEALTIKFLKKYIHYAKHRIEPELTDEASEYIATSYAELRNTGGNSRTGGTLPITARTLETIIRLSTAHAKLKLSQQVLKSDVEAALKVLNFAIYHQELTDMEEREQQQEKELERKRKADHDENNDRDDGERRKRKPDAGDGDGTKTGAAAGAMEVDEVPPVSSERVAAFRSAFEQHRYAKRFEQITITEIEQVVNSRAAVPYLRAEIMSLLESWQDEGKVMIVDDVVYPTY